MQTTPTDPLLDNILGCLPAIRSAGGKLFLLDASSSTSIQVGDYIHDICDPDPDPSKIKLDFVAWALARIARWTGNTTRTYSVAEHCCIVADLVNTWTLGQRPNLVLGALLHDATEVFIGDIPRPVKQFIRNGGPRGSSALDIVEQRIFDALLTAAGGCTLEERELKVIKMADDFVLRCEYVSLCYRPVQDSPLSEELKSLRLFAPTLWRTYEAELKNVNSQGEYTETETIAVVWLGKLRSLSERVKANKAKGGL